MARCNWTKAEVALESTQDPRLMALAERALSHYVNKTTESGADNDADAGICLQRYSAFMIGSEKEYLEVYRLRWR